MSYYFTVMYLDPSTAHLGFTIENLTTVNAFFFDINVDQQMLERIKSVIDGVSDCELFVTQGMLQAVVQQDKTTTSRIEDDGLNSEVEHIETKEFYKMARILSEAQITFRECAKEEHDWNGVPTKISAEEAMKPYFETVRYCNPATDERGYYKDCVQSTACLKRAKAAYSQSA